MRFDGPRTVRVPRIDLADKVLFGLTIRQLAWAAGGAATVWFLWSVLTAVAATAVAITVCAPVVLVTIAFVFVQRDGAGLDALLWAAIRMPRRPLIPAGSLGTVPEWVDATELRVQPRILRFPARGVTGDGLIDLGDDGYTIVLAVSAVNFALRSVGEQDALVAAFARGLHALSGPVQILATQAPADLSDHAAAITPRTLPEGPLQDAAAAHAAWLREASAGSRLLHRRCYIAARAATRARAERRAAEISDALTGCGLSCTPVTPVTLLELLDLVADPNSLHPQTGATT